ncbi:MAG: chromosomal replication initiator protein DnaA [Chloroflexi bacterium]|nr:chromosomal replication initiator protein DnaA [Chloroflexota bacterium]
MHQATAAQVWETALGQLQVQLSRSSYDTWLKNTQGLALGEDRFIVGTPNPFIREGLERRLYTLIRKTLMALTGQPNLAVEFQVAALLTATASRPAAPQAREESAFTENTTLRPPEAGLAPLIAWDWPYPQPSLNAKFTFERFVVGGCNQFSHAAAARVAERPGAAYNPLFLYGGVGLGKTHLLQAVGHRALGQSPKVLHVSGDQFTREFVGAIRNQTTDEFQLKYRSAEILLVDDVQFLAGREQTQESFFHIFNELHSHSRQIILASDRPPQAIPGLADRLVSRFQGGLLADLQSPELETRQAILRLRLEEEGCPCEDECLALLAAAAPGSIRGLEELLNRVLLQARLSQSQLNPALVAQALARSPRPSSRPATNPAAILGAVAEHFRLAPEALSGPSRDRRTSQARQVAIFLLREELRRPWAEIGRELGGRRDSSVLRGYARVSAALKADAELRLLVSQLRERLGAELLPPDPRSH